MSETRAAVCYHGGMRSARVVLLLAGLSATALAADHPVKGDLLRLRDPSRASARAVAFHSGRSATLTASPTTNPRRFGAVLEVAGAGPGDGTTGSVALEAGRWRGLGRPAGSRGWRYADRAAHGGIRSIVVHVGAKGGTFSISGGGKKWPYRVKQPQSAVDVRLRLGDELFCARFTSFAQNRPGRLLARNAPPPADCGGGSPPPGCGNGVLDAGEGCDDGNVTSLDGCSASCNVDGPAGLCAGVPADSGARLAAVPVVSGLEKPTHVTAPPLDTHRLFVVEQTGRIRLLKDGTLMPQPFLDVAGKISLDDERGLLSVAFHPQYATNRRFFIYYTNPDGDPTIARYQASPDGDGADPASEQVLLTIPHPGHANHNGGQLAFGPDGFLYAGTGDGGGGGDPGGNGQSDATLLGKLLRLDVEVETAPFYRAAPGNPFLGPGDPRDEIWAKGLRNPWRFSFDRATGDLYIADVGQDAWEEVDVQPASSPGGENYGWNTMEGLHCFSPPAGCSTAGLTLPVVEYGHDPACSITGGFVYRGCRMPDLRGTYFYGDLCAGFIRTFQGIAEGVAQNQGDRSAELTPDGAMLTTFGEDARGELYFTDYAAGTVFRIVPGS